jgi:hypothetical protein
MSEVDGGKRETIVIDGAGGDAGRGLMRCLKNHYNVYGWDESPWARKLIPQENLLKGAEKLNYKITPVDKLLGIDDVDVSCALYPEEVLIKLMQDKSWTAAMLGKMAPQTYWTRNVKGAGGAGAEMSQEYLPGPNVSVELVYHEGSLIGYFMKERLAYDLKGSQEPLHQRGSSCVSRCIYDKKYLKFADKAIRRICNKMKERPHGIFSVDTKKNLNGQIKITEINPGRFLTASYPFYYLTNYNLPLLWMKTLTGHHYKLGEYPTGTLIVRAYDREPYVENLVF